jgi:hypothetical protein
MAVNDPVWSYGQVTLYTSSGATVGNGDDEWSYGKDSIFHEYVAAGGVMAAIYYRTLLAGGEANA